MESKFCRISNKLTSILLIALIGSYVEIFTIEAPRSATLNHSTKEDTDDDLGRDQRPFSGFLPPSTRTFYGSQNQRNISENLCLTPECIHTASRILANMDRSVDPCVNFYQFACGNYIRNTKIPSDAFKVSAFEEIADDLNTKLQSDLQQPRMPNDPKHIRLMKTFYTSCMNTTQIEAKGLTYLKNIYKSSGGWPVLEQDQWKEQNFNWIQTVYELSKIGFNGFSVVSISIGVDSQNSSQHKIKISSPDLGPVREVLITGSGNPIVKAYYQFMVDVAVIFGANRNHSETEMWETLQFSIELATISLSPEQRKDEVKLYNPITLSKLIQNIPTIPWVDYINTVLLNETDVDEDTEVIVESFKFLKDLELLLQRTRKRTVANLLLWDTTVLSMPYLTEAVQKRKFEFTQLLSGQTMDTPRWVECISQIQFRMTLAAGSLYVQKHVDKGTREEATDMLDFIRASFQNRLSNTNWMDEKTIERALEKVAAIHSNIGYPDEFLDNAKVANYYKELELADTDYLMSYLNLSLFKERIQYRQLNQTVNRYDWKTHAYAIMVNAAYNPNENSIQIPAGILQGAFFHANRPRYMNYAAIGFVIAHEISHGFDTQGSHYDKNGNLVNWWEPETERSFSERTQCIIQQYGNYTIPQLNIKLNGTQTTDENIADNGGVKVSYGAYQDWMRRNEPEPLLPGLNYTVQQLFWLSGANIWCSKLRLEIEAFLAMINTHSPTVFRINGPFSNAEEFSRDFNCPIGSPMNRTQKCVIW